jgi:hypothetical protein
MRVSYATVGIMASYGDEEARHIMDTWEMQGVGDSQAYFSPSVGFFLGDTPSGIPKGQNETRLVLRPRRPTLLGMSLPKTTPVMTLVNDGSVIIEDDDGDEDGLE